MSEEEAKAIKELRHYINITEYWKQKEYTNSEIDHCIKILLNLIEKQQKEIEELKEINEDNAEKSLLNDIFIKNNYISKDKIREKIKDYTEKSKHPLVNSQSTREYTFALRALKELLEEK